MNRADRRRLSRLEEKAPRSFNDFNAFIEEANRLSDPENPLRYTGGYVHVGCGGEAERPSNYGAGAYCHRCLRTVPVEDTEKR